MKNSIVTKVTNRIHAKQAGWVFTPKDFLDLGTRSNIDFILHSLVQKKIIRNIGRGIYDFPINHSKLGMLSPSTDNILRAISVQTGEIIQSSGAEAANWLGLSTQVPAQPIYLTSGNSRKINIGKEVIHLKHTSITPLNNKSAKTALVIQALLYMGKHHIDETIIRTCANQLSSQQKEDLKLMAAQVPNWLTPIIHNIAA